MARLCESSVVGQWTIWANNTHPAEVSTREFWFVFFVFFSTSVRHNIFSVSPWKNPIELLNEAEGGGMLRQHWTEDGLAVEHLNEPDANVIMIDQEKGKKDCAIDYFATPDGVSKVVWTEDGLNI